MKAEKLSAWQLSAWVAKDLSRIPYGWDPRGWMPYGSDPRAANPWAIWGILGFKVDRTDAQRLETLTLFPFMLAQTADLTMHVYSPYFGLMAGTPFNSFSVTWSPWLTTVEADVPVALIERGQGLGLVMDMENQFKVKSSGANVIELAVDSNVPLARYTSLNVWGKLNRLNWQGKGKGIGTLLFPLSGIDITTSDSARHTSAGTFIAPA